MCICAPSCAHNVLSARALISTLTWPHHATGELFSAYGPAQHVQCAGLSPVGVPFRGSGSKDRGSPCSRPRRLACATRIDRVSRDAGDRSTLLAAVTMMCGLRGSDGFLGAERARDCVWRSWSMESGIILYALAMFFIVQIASREVWYRVVAHVGMYQRQAMRGIGES